MVLLLSRVESSRGIVTEVLSVRSETSSLFRAPLLLEVWRDLGWPVIMGWPLEETACPRRPPFASASILCSLLLLLPR